jgi:hypothetical protein
MSSLTTCLKKAGQYIDPADKAAILKSAQALRKSGVSAGDAAVQAVQAQIEVVRKLMGDAAPVNATAATPEATTKPATKKQPEPDRLTDAGEELTRNRRGRLKGLAWADVSEMNDTLKVSQVIKANVWPRPDYIKMVEDGAPVWKAAAFKAVYDKLAAAPVTRATPTDPDLRAYIETMHSIRDALTAELDRAAAAPGGEKTWQSLKGENVFGKVFVVPADARPMFGKPSPFDRSSEKGKENNKRAMLIGGNSAVQALQFDYRVLSKIKSLVAEGFPAKQEAWQKSWEVRATETRNDDVPEADRTGEPQQRFYVYEKGSRWRMAKGGQDGGYATEEQAAAFARSLTARKKEVLPPSRGLDLADANRVGPDWRNGKDVTAQEIIDRFGFRGVNLGEYVKAKQGVAQVHLNHVYDAFSDLADLMGVPPKAMSLNGQLGVAIGAQGSGKALAHFVPGVNEINITRDSGAGALAHEFGHAMDHYFAAQHGRAASVSKRPYLSAVVGDLRDDGGVRPEVMEAMRMVMKTINSRPMTEAEARKYMEDQRTRNERYLDGWVKEFSSNRGADVAALKATAAKLKRGEVGETNGTEVESNIAEFIRAAGLKPGNSTTMNAVMISYRLRDLADEASFLKNHIPQIDTNYAKASSAMDAKKSGDGYWATPWEKFARSFETFVMDALKTRQRESLYLSGLVDSDGWRDWAVSTGRSIPYPEGDERLQMQQAFQTLADTIQTKTDDAGNVAMFSRSAPVQSEAFKKWFGDSKVVDADGKPLVVYHGTNKDQQGEAFTMLDAYASNYGLFGQGAYLTADPSVASEYTSKGRGDSPSVYPLYASIKNPIDMDAKADPQKWIDAYPDFDVEAYHEGGTSNESYYRAVEEALRDEGMEKWEGAEAMQDGLRRMGHDGITHIGGGRVKSEGKKHRVFIAFDPEQIKSATGNAGTFDPSNPDIRASRPFDADMFRQMTSPMQRGMTVAAVEKDIAPVLKRWKNGPSVTVVATPSDLPMVAPFDAHGVYFNGKVYIVAANVRNTAKLMQVLGHEAIAHYGLRESLGATGFRQFTSQVQLALKSGNKPLAAIRAEVRAAYVDENGKFNLSPEQESDEIAAKVVEQAIDADGDFRPGFGFVKAVYAKIVEFLRSLGITVKFTMPELQGMLVNAQRSLEVGKRTAGSRETLAPVFAMTGDQPAANALQALSEMDELFAIPKSSATTIEGILRDLDPEIKVKKAPAVPGREDYDLTLADGSLATITVRPHNRYGESVYGFTMRDGEMTEMVVGRPGENPDDVGPVDDVWIDVSGLKTGNKMGPLIYSAAANYAHNTGKIFIGDPAGLSDVALRRRTEQMLSSALKFGTTDHLAPHPRQVDGDAKLKVPGLTWVYGDSVGNIERMIDVSMKALENEFPSAKLIGYDAPSNKFYRTDTLQRFADRGQLARVVGQSIAKRFGVDRAVGSSQSAGWRTVARNALFRNLREASDVEPGNRDGRGILDRLRAYGARDGRNPDTGRAYAPKERILYARSADSLNSPGATIKSPADVEAEAVIDRQNPPTAGQPDLFTPGFWETPQDTRTDRFIFELQDGRIDLKRVQQAIAKVGGQIREQFDARLAETLYPGRVARRAQQFLEDEAQPLLEVMARNNVPMAELSDYLHARGAEERNAQIAKVNPDLPDGGAGRNSKGLLLTNAAARKYLADVRPARKMVLDALAKRVDAITSGTRKLLVDEGLEKAETIASWEAAYQNYVPMFRDEAEEGRPHPTGSGMSVRGSASKRATGSTKEVTNILAHVLMQREAAITRAEKNRVAVALYGMALTNPNPDFWTTIRPGMTAEAIGRELQRMGVDPTVAEAGMKGVPTIRTVDPVLNRVVDRPNPIYKSLPGAIVLKVNGDDRVLMLNERDPRGLRMAENLKNLDGLTRLDIAGSVVGKTTRWLASVNTQYNPAFGLVNLTRDTLGGAINLSSTKLRGKTTKVLALTPAAIWGIGRELAGRPSGQWGKLFRQFQADGGQTGYREMFKDANDRTARLQAELKSLEKAGKLSSQKVGGMLLGALDVFNTTLENAVRLAAYKEALQEGMSRAEAARLGRELTVDFNRKGRTGREVSPLYAFFNAAVQGSARTLQTLAGPAGAKIIAGGVTLGVMQALMLLFADYDDDEIPEFVKSRALVIPLGKNEEGKKEFFTIPYPLGLHVLPNTGRVLAELTLSGGEDVAAKGFAAVGEIASAFNPLGGGNIFTGDGALRTIAPTLVDPIVELAANKNFAGAPIEREPQGENDPRPGFQRAREATLRTATGQTYTDISRIINTMTGGDDYEKGLASPSPERVRYLAQVVGGGLLREIEKTINTSIDAAKDQPVKPTGIPVVGRFYGEVDDANVQRSRYFDNLREIETLERKIKAADKAGDVDAATRMEEDGPLVDAVRASRRAKKEVAELNREAMETIGDPATLRALDAERTEAMRELNDEVEDIKRETKGKTPGEKLREAAGVAEP